MRNSVISTLAAVSATLAVAVSAGSADAAITRTAAPERIVAGSRTVSFTVSARSTSTVSGSHVVSALAPMRDRLIQVGTGASRTGTVSIRVKTPARYLAPGRNEWVLEDAGDGSWSTVSATVVRQSRLTLTRADPAADGKVRVCGLLRHYQLKTGKYGPSNLSPVRVQQLVAGRWTNLGRWTTNRSGLGGTTVRPLPGRVVLRLVRPEGATVTAATSNRVEVDR